MVMLGCHLSTREGFLGMAQETVAMGANTFQYFTRNPRGGHVRDLDPKDIAAYNEYAPEHGITTAIAYAPYDIEPATNDMSRRDFALLVMSEDMNRLEEVPGQMYLIRPGSALDTPKDQALKNVAEAVNQTITPHQNTKILLCTMSGEGSQVGNTFEELATIIENITLKDRIGICLDASSVWACGYDIVNDLDGVLDEFDKAIGLDKLLAVHLNDSKEAMGSHVDRHALIGEGTIGFDALAAMVKNPRLAHAAFIIEEPHGELAIYAKDIKAFLAAAQ